MNIYQKLIEIREAVPYLKKENRGTQYNYVSSSQVIAAVRSKLDELGLMITPEITDHALHASKDKRGTDVYLTELSLKYTIINTEKPEEKIIFPWYAQGIDRAGEKGVGKALTYAEKYFFLKLFNVPTDQDDPDAFQRKTEAAALPQPKQKHSTVHRRPVNDRTVSRKTKETGGKIDDIQKAKINNLISEYADLCGKTNADIVKALEKIFKVNKLNDAYVATADAMIESLKKWIDGRKRTG